MELRPGYKQTEVGVIPEDWDTLPFDAVFRKVAAKNYQIQSKEYQPTGAFPIVDQGQLPVVGYSNRTDRVFCVPPEGVVIFGDHTCIVKHVRHDFVVGADGTQILIAKQGQRAAFHAYALTARPVETTGYNRHFKFLKERIFQAPPTTEQHLIAEVLSDVDSAIGALSRLIAKKRGLRQGAMQRLLTGQTRLPGFTGPWQVKRLGELGRFIKGSGVRRDQAQSGDIPCVRYGEIYTTHHDVIRHFASRISRAVADTATRIQRGDLLFAGSGETKEEIGKCVALADDVEAYAGGDIIILRPLGGNPVFLGYLMNTPQVVRQKANKGQGDAVVHISAAALGAIEISLPDEKEQDAIASVLSDMDAEFAALDARLEKTRALKQAMMQALLTGRVRLPLPREARPEMREAAHA
jgi:type I restriction enzyme S subunit